MSSARLRGRPLAVRPLRMLAAVLLLVLAVASGTAATASADPSTEIDLLGTMPPANAEVARPPEVARAVFSGPIEPSGPGLEVHNADGERVDGGVVEPAPSPAVIDAVLPVDLPAGEYRASWQVRSETGEVAEGSWEFVVLDPPNPGIDGDAGSTPASRGLVVGLALLALVLAAGSLWFARGRLE
jgi:methionine-rich copper-binding protein CopC